MKKTYVISTVLIAVLLAACGGGGGGGSGGGTSTTNGNTSGGGAGQPTVTGRFIDAAVSGIRYTTATQSGFTSDLGEFVYVPGESVTFSVGDMTLPPVTAKSIVTPLDLADTNDPEDPKVVNMLVALQSLDEDANPANGIKIPSRAHDVSKRKLDWSADSETFRAHPDFASLVQSAAGSARTPVTLQAAKAHFADTLQGKNGVTVTVAAVPKLQLLDKMYAGRTYSYYKNQSYHPSGQNLTNAKFDYTLTDPAGAVSKFSGSGNANNRKFTLPGKYTLSLSITDANNITSRPVSYEFVVQDVQYVQKVSTEQNPANVFTGYLNKFNCQNLVQNGAINGENRQITDKKADQLMIEQILSTTSPDAYHEYQKLPFFFVEWVRGYDLMSGSQKFVYLQSLMRGVHEINHFLSEGQHECDKKDTTATDYGLAQYYFDGQWHTTDIVMYYKNNNISSGATYAAIDAFLQNKYKSGTQYNRYVKKPDSRLRLEAVLDELLAYVKSSRFEKAFFDNAALHDLRSLEADSASYKMLSTNIELLYFMLYTQAYIQEMRLNTLNLEGTAGTYTTLQSARTVAFLQKLWAAAEQALVDAYQYTNDQDSTILNREDWNSILTFRYSMLADIYEPNRIKELHDLGIKTKSLADWQDTYLKSN